jgi:hypothetical protein
MGKVFSMRGERNALSVALWSTQTVGRLSPAVVVCVLQPSVETSTRIQGRKYRTLKFTSTPPILPHGVELRQRGNFSSSELSDCGLDDRGSISV